MPTYKISQLTTATAVSATNQFEINQNGTSKSVEVSVIDAYIKSTSNLPVVVSVSSATDAVRITQTGTGKALVIEDSTNPDSTPIVFDTDGRLLVGTSVNVGSGTLLQLANKAISATPAALDYSKDRAGATVVDGDQLGYIRYFGYDGGAYRQAASIIAEITGTVGSNIMPTNMTFRTRSETATGDQIRMSLNSSGSVFIGNFSGDGAAISTTNPAKLRIGAGQYTDNSTAASGTVNFGTLTSIVGATVNALNTGVTYTTLPTVYINAAPVAGTNVTITNPYAFYVAAGASYFGGQLQTAAGTAAAPAISTIGDTNTGMFFSAADTLAISTAGTERMRIDNLGRVGINSTALTGYQVRIAGTYASTDVNPIWMAINGTIPSTATGQAYGFFSGSATQAAAFTLTGLNHFFASQGGVGAGSALTNQYGFRANSNLTGATNNFGFYSDIASGTGRWNFYAAGTADNFFGGPTTISTSSTSDALRITQTGTGNALVVEDSTNPDATPFVVDANGNVVQGSTSPLATIPYYSTGNVSTPALQQISAAAPQLAITGHSSSQSFGPAIALSRASGDSVSAPTAVSSGFDVGAVSFSGYDGTGFIRAAQILAEVDGTPGTNDMPGRLVFSTTADGASSPTERMRITSTGNVVAGGSAALATTATDGFLYVPTCAGTPTGTPTTITGMAPIVINTTNNKLYFYSGGAWRDAGP